MVHIALYCVAALVGVGVCVYSMFTMQSNQAHVHERPRNPYNHFIYRPDPNETIKCLICLEDLETINLQILQCGHRYHSNCLEAAIRNEVKCCPLCRKPLKFE